MYYKINVTLNGNFFFSTSDNSIIDRSKLAQVWTTFLAKFPSTQGFGLSIMECSEKDFKPSMLVNKEDLK